MLTVSFAFLTNSYAVTQLNWATAPVGGTYYATSIGITNVINKYVPEVQVTVETSSGAVANCRLVGEGTNDFGLTNSNFGYFSVNGLKPYKQKYKIYAGAVLFPSALHIVVMAKSPIKSIADYKGKKVGVGPTGGGTVQTLKDLLPCYGLKQGDLKWVYVGWHEQASLLKDGNINVHMHIGGAPGIPEKELAQTANIRFISVEEDIIEKMVSKHGYYLRTVFPKSMFNTPQDIVTVGLGNLWIIRDGMQEDLIYKMTKAMFEHLEELGTYHPQAKNIRLETATKAPIPLHPGAIRYYKEKGLLK